MSFITITTNGEFGNTHQTFNSDNGGHMKALAMAAAHITLLMNKAEAADKNEWIDVPAFLRKDKSDGA